MYQVNHFNIKNELDDGACLFRCMADHVYNNQILFLTLLKKACFSYICWANLPCTSMTTKAVFSAFNIIYASFVL